MFYLIFFSQQVKRCGIITYKQGICDLPLELPNNLRILGNKEKSGKSWKLTVSSYHANQNDYFVNTSEKLWKNRNQTFPVVHFSAWKLELVSNILWMIVAIWKHTA